MRLWSTVREYVLPTQANVYRPRLLSRPWLMLFLCVSLAVEGFLMSSLVVAPTDGAFITQGSVSSNMAAASAAQQSDSFFQSLARQFFRVFGDPEVANAILVVIGGMLLVLIGISFLFHIDVQSRDLLLGAAAVSIVALLCFAANVHFVLHTPQSANAQAFSTGG